MSNFPKNNEIVTYNNGDLIKSLYDPVSDFSVETLTDLFVAGQYYPYIFECKNSRFAWNGARYGTSTVTVTQYIKVFFTTPSFGLQVATQWEVSNNKIDWIKYNPSALYTFSNNLTQNLMAYTSSAGANLTIIQSFKYFRVKIVQLNWLGAPYQLNVQGLICHKI